MHFKCLNKVWWKVFAFTESHNVMYAMHDALLTCARSTAPSAVVMSTIPLLRVASLASRPPTGLCNVWLVSRLTKAGIRPGGGEEKTAWEVKVSKLLYQNFNHKGAVRWLWDFPISGCVCVFHTARGSQMFVCIPK